MITYLRGSVLTKVAIASADVFIHGCNCHHKWGTGVAAIAKHVFPEAYMADLQTGWGDISKLGSFSVVDSPKGIRVYNLYSQYRYSWDERVFDYNAFEKALVEINKELPDRTTIIMPMIGSGAAGGSWARIEQILIRVLSRHQLNIYVPSSRK